ncbi:unnamed protein product [Prorocentrum cordatum]|uniref:PIPK domain-containing protein n=1 Tax=Prorocentrum cordatum TaxID=2364126 RepID=A0ABN9QV71_9DINO|nr:unnamed protein product [Polarella glacialis]
MVDVLTRYTCAKRLETLLGRCRGAAPGRASCQPPSRYAARFCSFMRHVLACPGSLPAASGVDYEAAWIGRGGRDEWPPPAWRACARADIELSAASGASAV